MKVDLAVHDFEPEFDERRDPTRCSCGTWHVALPCVDCKAPMAYAEHQAMGGRCEPCWERWRSRLDERLERKLAKLRPAIDAMKAAERVRKRYGTE